MSKRILKVVIFMAVMGLGVNLYAQITEDDIQFAKDRLIQEKKTLNEQKSQLNDLFKEAREVIKAVDSLKKENGGLKVDLIKLKEINAKLESDTRDLSMKNQELQRVTKKDVLKQENIDLKVDLAKLKEAKDKLESATKDLSIKNQELEQTMSRDDNKQEVLKLRVEITKLQDFSAALQKKAEDLYVQNQELAPAKEQARSLSSMVEYLNRERQALKKMNEQLRQDMITLQDNTRKEKAALYEELGTSYVQSKLYDLAIDTYEKSIKLVPGNAEVYYNLGLLYKHNPPGNSDKALRNFKRYLELAPKAKNRKEVEYFIQMLVEAPDRKFGLW